MIQKLSKLLNAAYQVFRKPYLLNHILDSQIIKKDYVINKFNVSEGLPVIDSSLLFSDEITIEPFAYLNGACIPTDIALLKSLALRIRANNYFEIGTWRGESVANLAAVVPQCVTFNLSGEELLSMGLPKEYAELHGFFSNNLKNVTHIFGNSLKYNFIEHFKKYDLVFIDGDHHYESVRKDTETAFKLIKNENSIIVWHDYALQPETIRWEVLAGILDGCPADKRSKIYHASNTLCAIFLNEEIASTKLTLYSNPDKYFKLLLTLKKINS